MPRPAPQCYCGNRNIVAYYIDVNGSTYRATMVYICNGCYQNIDSDGLLDRSYEPGSQSPGSGNTLCVAGAAKGEVSIASVIG